MIQFLIAIAFAVLAVTILVFIGKLFITCAAYIKGDDVKVSFGWQFTIIFICVLFIAIYFLFA